VVPSVFTGHQLVDSSRVLTASASLVVAVPRSVWRIRPYAVLGVGLVRSTSSDAANLLPISSTQPGFHLGGGVWVPVAKRVALRGDVRFLRTTDRRRQRVCRPRRVHRDGPHHRRRRRDFLSASQPDEFRQQRSTAADVANLVRDD
jgi:hypothetical protein